MHRSIATPPAVARLVLAGALGLGLFDCGSSASSPAGPSPNSDASVDVGDGSSTNDDSGGGDSVTSTNDSGSVGDDSGSGVDGGSDIGVVDAGNCPGLPATGAWKDVSPPAAGTTAADVAAIAVRPDFPSTIYAGVVNRGIFRSVDCGATWAVVSTGAHADDMKSGNPWSLAIDPIAPDTMYAVVGYGSSGLWKTTDAGVDWQNVLTDPAITTAFYANGFITGVGIDPTDHTHVIVESHGNCASGFTCAAESLDSGGTWKLIDMKAVGQWSENSAIAMLDKKNWLYCGLFSGFFRTSDEGATWQAVDAGGVLPSCNYYDPFVWQASDGRYYVPAIAYAGAGLLQSEPHDSTKWQIVTGSPQTTALMPTSTNLVTSRGGTAGGTAAFWIAPQSDPTKWQSFAVPSSWTSGNFGVFLAYDGSHHVLYSANWEHGLWQIVTD